MKRFYYFLLALLPVIALSSCSSEDDLPDVEMSVTYSGATDIDNVLYVVQGNVLSIDALTVTPVDASKKATIGATAYYWNYQYVGTTIREPFGMSFDTATMPVGDYVLQINSTVYQVDKSVGQAYFTYLVKIVANESDVPGAVTGSGTDKPDVDVRSGALPTR
ncbi:MAG: hypothetical protein HDS92_06420 [Bacteroidales bacterium]|nr:hypothetical protein [Bacteroidales bacterium]